MMILIEGCSHFVDRSLCPNVGGDRPVSFDQCASDVENLISAQILGNGFNLSQWCFSVQQN